MVHDTLERVRPKLVFPEAKADADKAVMSILKHERENLDLSEEKEGELMEQEDQDEDEETESESESESGSDSSASSDSDSEDSDDSDAPARREDLRDYRREEKSDTQHQKEVDDFDREVQQMLIDSLERERVAPRSGLDLPEPPASKRPEAGPPATFSLLQKPRGGKITLKQIEIPEDSKLHQAARVEESEDTKEKEELKRYILEYDQNSSAAGSGLPLGNLQMPHRNIIVHHRGGKGGHKGGGGHKFNPRDRKNDHGRDDPDEDRSEPHGRGRGGRGGRGGGNVIRGKTWTRGGRLADQEEEVG